MLEHFEAYSASKLKFGGAFVNLGTPARSAQVSTA